MTVPIASGGASGTTAEGGIGVPATYTPVNFYRIYQCMSNELSTPKVLYCPADYDATVVQATTFGVVTAGQTGQAFVGNGNLSYFTGADASDTSPQMLLLGDHAMGNATANNNTIAAINGYGSTAANQAAGYATVATETGTNSATITAAWMDNSQHGKNANVALSDGSVSALNIAKLREALKNSGDPAQNRLLFP